MNNPIRPLLCLLAILVGVSASASAQEIVLQAAKATVVAGGWAKVSDSTAAAGARISMPEKGLAKITTPQAAPINYFEMSFTANAGTAYRLWFRGKAAANSYSADSAYIQFSDSVTSSGASSFRIGSTAATTVTIEDCSGCGVSGWGWNDNYYGSSQGSLIYFRTTGSHTIRIQNREDGLSIDQIVLSPVRYRSSAPGDNKNDDTILEPATGTAIATLSTSTVAATKLRVLQWNSQHGGVGTDGVLDPARFIHKAASFRPDVVSFNEVERYDSYANYDGPAKLAALMEQYTGQRWYYKFATGSGAANGRGNMILSRFPFIASVDLLGYNGSALDVGITVNGRTINFTTTHLYYASTTWRLSQIGDLLAWQKGFAEARIIAGDFNAQPGTTESATMRLPYIDSWAQAQQAGTAIAYPGNTAGNTRNTRLDYIYYSKGATTLQLISSQVFDVRDANGIMPSDHRPLLSVFEIH